MNPKINEIIDYGFWWYAIYISKEFWRLHQKNTKELTDYYVISFLLYSVGTYLVNKLRALCTVLRVRFLVWFYIDLKSVRGKKCKGWRDGKSSLVLRRGVILFNVFTVRLNKNCPNTEYQKRIKHLILSCWYISNKRLLCMNVKLYLTKMISILNLNYFSQRK